MCFGARAPPAVGAGPRAPAGLVPLVAAPRQTMLGVGGGRPLSPCFIHSLFKVGRRERG